MRQGIWNAAQDVAPIDAHIADTLSPKIHGLVEEMVRIMKFRVVSYQRATRLVVEYTTTAIHRAKLIAKHIYSAQDQLSKQIQHQSTELLSRKLDQVPLHLPATLTSSSSNSSNSPNMPIPPSVSTSTSTTSTMSTSTPFKQAFQVHSKRQVMDAMKQKAKDLYTSLSQLQNDKIHAVLNHDKLNARAVETRIRKLKTQVRALTGARQYLASSQKIDFLDLTKETDASMTRLAQSLTHQKVMDHDMYRMEVVNQIEEHANGMALFLGLKTQKEIHQLKHDLVKEVCANVALLFKDARQEVYLLNQELSLVYAQLMSLHPPALLVAYLEAVVLRYRGDIAKIQVSLLELFDKR